MTMLVVPGLVGRLAGLHRTIVNLIFTVMTRITSTGDTRVTSTGDTRVSNV